MTAVYSPTSDYPRVTIPLVIYTRREWSDDWELRPDLEPMTVEVATAAGGSSQCTFRRKYGQVLDTYESAPSGRTPNNLDRWWVCVRMASQHGMRTAFVGRVGAETRSIYGSDTAKSGEQSWTAYGPQVILDKIAVSRSFWLRTAEEGPSVVVDCAWLPSLNDRDDRGTAISNRSATTKDGTYLYGEPPLTTPDDDDAEEELTKPAEWTHREYIDYILAKFAEGTTDPVWSLTGQTALLDDLVEVIDWGTSVTVGEILRRLMRPEKGLDYMIRYREPNDDDDEPDGFDIQVFSLLAKDYSFQNVTMSGNASRVTFNVSGLADMRCTIESSQDHAYGRVRVIGDRIVVCCTLQGNDLVPKWASGLAEEYNAGTGDADDPAWEHDEARQREHLNPVFSHFGAPEFWDMHADLCAPALDESAAVIPGESDDYQRTARSTLSWLPLYQGYDYSQFPAVDNNLTTTHPDLIPPAAWIYDAALEHYITLGTIDAALYTVQADWGIAVKANPPHLIAGTDFETAAPTVQGPVYDYETLIATIAFRSDQRLMLELAIDDHQPSDGTLDVYVDDAELWYLAPNTILGINPGADEALVTSGDSGRVLRNDADRLAEVMAATVARYYASRNRARLTMAGYWPWTGFLGYILAGVEEGGDTHGIEAAITSLSWDVQAMQTTLRTGYAQ